MSYDEYDFSLITTALQNGETAVVRTDTLYGIIALANNETAVEKVYTTKQRDPSKQCIILIASPKDTPAYGEIIDQYGAQSEQPTSVIIPATSEPAWVLRGGDSVAYRVVRDPFLKRVVETVGPVIAPSANPEGQPPARTVQQAQQYFGGAVGAYIDGGEVPETVQASRIVQVQRDGSVTEIRASNA